MIINLPETSNPNFRPRVEGEYKIGLIVNDSLANSTEDELMITAVEGFSSIDQNSTEKSYLKTYPNPVNNQLNIEYYLSTPGKFDISIYNISGQKISTCSSEFQASGVYIYNLNPDPVMYNKGLYFIVLNTNQGLCSDTFVIE